LDARLRKVACSQSSLLEFRGATLIRHGQDGHATRRGTGVPLVTGVSTFAYGVIRALETTPARPRLPS